MSSSHPEKYLLHDLHLLDIHLTKNPLDDYQRLFFTSYYLKNLYQGTTDTTVNLHITRSNYKSNVAQAFNYPVYLNNNNNNNNNNCNNNTHIDDASTNTLECYEYQLPDLQMGNTTYNLTEDIINGTIHRDDPIRENLKLSKENCNRLQLLKDCKVIFDNSNAENTQQPTELPHTGLDTTDDTLSKNQQFKLTKLDHNLQINDKLINPNNCIIWCYGSGYVFLTGIWRLYQDVMKGLITIPHYTDNDDSNSSIDLQKKCKLELEYIMTSAFYEDVIIQDNNLISPSKKKRRSSIASLQEIIANSSNPPLNTTENVPSTTVYTDLHWNNMSQELKNQTVSTFKKAILSNNTNDNINLDLLNSITLNDLIQRIRGGYIKIQGTWLPMEIAKLLCTRFCYPIRFFLVPVFGPDFPKECETWYNTYSIDIVSKLKIIKPPSHTTTTHTENVSPKTIVHDEVKKRKPRQRKPKSATAKKNASDQPATVDASQRNKELQSAFQNLLNVSKNPNLSVAMDKYNKDLTRHSMPTLPTHFVKANTRLPSIRALMETVFAKNTNNSNRVNTNMNNYHAEGRNSLPNMQPAQYPVYYPGNSSNTAGVVIENEQNPTVQTLSYLASFYNTHGHRYSYPGGLYSPAMEQYYQLLARSNYPPAPTNSINYEQHPNEDSRNQQLGDSRMNQEQYIAWQQRQVQHQFLLQQEQETQQFLRNQQQQQQQQQHQINNSRQYNYTYQAIPYAAGAISQHQQLPQYMMQSNQNVYQYNYQAESMHNNIQYDSQYRGNEMHRVGDKERLNQQSLSGQPPPNFPPPPDSSHWHTNNNT